MAIVILTLTPAVQARQCMAVTLQIPDTCTFTGVPIVNYVEAGTDGFRYAISNWLGHADAIRSDDQYVGCEGIHVQIRPTDDERCDFGPM
jgi:hypothetical protein